MDEKEIESRWNDLLDWYKENDIERALVAFSGGKDSTLVLDSAVRALENVKAFIIDDVMYPDWEIKEAVSRAEELGADYEIIKTSKLSNEDLRRNPEDRCYYCKRELFASIEEEGTVLEGTNATEIKGHRPGLEAVKEQGRAPLLEIGMEEEEIREILKWRGREVWDRPSFACLASRFPSGTELSEEKLKKVERLEDKIFELGVRQLRIRDFDEVARIEVWPEDMSKLLENREEIIGWFKEEGYEKVFLDLEGYRTGSISQ